MDAIEGLRFDIKILDKYACSLAQLLEHKIMPSHLRAQIVSECRAVTEVLGDKCCELDSLLDVANDEVLDAQSESAL